jgi:hypothetical protein
MKKDELIALGLTDEQAAKVFALRGDEIKAEKEKFDSMELKYKGDLQTVQDSLKAFDGVDVTTLKKDLETLKQTLIDKDKKYQADIDERDYNSEVKETLLTAKARNIKAAMALLDHDTLRASKNRKADIDAAINGDNGIKAANEYLFESEKKEETTSKSSTGFAHKDNGAQSEIDYFAKHEAKYKKE